LTTRSLPQPCRFLCYQPRKSKVPCGSINRAARLSGGGAADWIEPVSSCMALFSSTQKTAAFHRRLQIQPHLYQQPCVFQNPIVAGHVAARGGLQSAWPDTRSLGYCWCQVPAANFRVSSASNVPWVYAGRSQICASSLALCWLATLPDED